MKTLSLLFLIRHITRSWHLPTLGFSAISRHLLQVVHFNDGGGILELIIELLSEIHPPNRSLFFGTESSE
jgi:hypothetical protein